MNAHNVFSWLAEAIRLGGDDGKLLLPDGGSLIIADHAGTTKFSVNDDGAVVSGAIAAGGTSSFVNLGVTATATLASANIALMSVTGTAGFGGLVQLVDVGTLAPAGTNQATAAAITDMITTSTGDGTAGLVLPTAAAGKLYIVYNLHATAGLLIYPASGDDINDGTTDQAITIEGKTNVMFLAVDAATWITVGGYTANT